MDCPGAPATTVAPGDSAVVRLRVRNTGDTVEEYRLSPVGDAAGWASVEPTVLRLYPGTEGTAEVTFAPPRTPDAVAGQSPFGIRVDPREHPGEADVVEGRLTISPFAEMRAELVPRTVKGRRRAKGRVAVDNLGNQPLTASFSTRDNADAVTVEANPTAVQVDPGRAGFAEVQLTSANVSWFGGIRQHQFNISVLRSGDPAPQELRGTYVQPSVFPRWVLAVGSVLVAAAVAFALIWFQHDVGVKSQASEKAPTKEEPLPQGSNTPLPSAPPAPRSSRRLLPRRPRPRPPPTSRSRRTPVAAAAEAAVVGTALPSRPSTTRTSRCGSSPGSDTSSSRRPTRRRRAGTSTQRRRASTRPLGPVLARTPAAQQRVRLHLVVRAVGCRGQHPGGQPGPDVGRVGRRCEPVQRVDDRQPEVVDPADQRR